MVKLYTCVLLIALLVLTNEAQIIPDPYDPIAISFPSEGVFGDKDTVIRLQFTLAPPHNSVSGLMQDFSTGLYYHQYIGVTIPSIAFAVAGSFKCEGSYYDKEDQNKKVPLLFSEDTEPSELVAYCRLEDSNHFILPGNKVELLITMLQNFPSLLATKEVMSLSLFTSSKKDKAYTFDSIPVFGTFSVHPKFNGNAQVTLSLECSNLPLVIDTVVDFYVTINLNQWFLFSDYTFAFNYEPRCFKVIQARTSVDLLKGKADSDPIPPIGSFFVRNFTKNSRFNSIAAEFTHYGEAYNNQRFIIAFKGIGLEDMPQKLCKTKVAIHNKNTNSVVAFIQSDFEIIGPTISLRAKDSDNSSKTNNNEFFASGAFPIQFTITSSLTLSKFYLMIHQIKRDAEAQITFIASTCDLSGLNGLIPSNLFAARPSCYPLFFENDETKTEGSGFFVFIEGPIKSYTEYNIIIWAFFDQCGPPDLGELNRKYYRFIELEMSFYRKIDKTQIGKNRFDPTQPLSTSSSTFEDILCYNTYLGKLNANGYTVWPTSNDGKEDFFYREYFDWNMFNWNPKNQLSTTTLDPAYFYMTNPTAISPPPPTPLQLNNGDNIFVQVKGPPTISSIEYFPLALEGTTVINSKISFKFSKSFVTKTKSDTCYVTWTFIPNGDLKPPDCVSECSWIGTPNTVTSPKTNMGNQASVYEAEVLSAADYSNRKFLFGTATDASSAPAFKFASNCHQINFFSEKVTSIYQPFQILIGIIDKEESGRRKYRKMMRMIKLFPEPGVFHKYNPVSKANLLTNHHSFIDKTNPLKGVCLLELSNEVFRASTTNPFNTLALWIFLGSLIETDYETISQYPVTNLNANVKSYGLPSQHGLNQKNYYAKIQGTTPQTAPINHLRTITSSSYHFFMGSLLILNQINTGSIKDTNSPILFPYYCPQISSDILEYKDYPTIVGAFMNSIDHSNWSFGVEQYLEDSLSKKMVFSSAAKKTATLNFDQEFTPVIFSSFILDQPKISVNLNTFSANAHIMMFDDSLFEAQDGKPPLPASPAGTFYYKKLDGYLHPFGKQYTGFLFQINSVASTGKVDFIPWFKIKNKSFFSSGGSLSSIDKVGYWSLNSSPDNKFGSNFVSSNFISSYTDHNSDAWIFQNTTEIDRLDSAISFYFEIKLPGTLIPLGSVLYFKLTPTASICGVTGANGFMTDCIFDTTNSVYKCLIFETELIIKVSCYSFIAPNAISPSAFELRMPNTPDTLDPNINTLVYSTTNSPQMTPSTSTPEDMVLIQFVDNFANHKSALGKMVFEVDLKGNLPRNSLLTIGFAELPQLLLTGIPPRCIVSFKSQFPFRAENHKDDPDKEIEKALIESCEVDGVAKVIKVKVKNISYKAAFALPKKVYVHLWPMKIIDLTYKDYTLKVEVSIFTKNSAKIFEPLLPVFYKHKVTEADIEGKFTATRLTEISALSLGYPGEKADYTFKFYLSNAEVISAFNEFILNEITIYFKPEDFPAFKDELLCYDEDGANVLLRCFYSGEGVLNIQFTEEIKGKDKSITLSSLRNPPHLIGQPITYAYSLNAYDHSDKKRRFTLLYGTGTNVNTAQIAYATNSQGLHFHKLPGLKMAISDVLLRREVEHTFRVGFDTASNYSPLPSPPLTNAKFIIDFPRDYQLYAPLQTPAISIDEYYSSKPLLLPTEVTKVTIGTTTMRSNRLYFTAVSLLKDHVLGTKEFLFWEVKIKGITLPKDLSIDYNCHTGPYSIMLINGNAYYSTQLNSYSFSTDLIEASDPFRYSQWHKGSKLETETKASRKWYIDVQSQTGKTGINNLEIQPGRYYKARFITKENPNGLAAITDITLNDAVFKTMEEKYTLLTTSFDGAEFSIGCTCDTAIGSYFITFEVANAVDFEVMIPIRVQLYADFNFTSKITYDKPSEIPVDSSIWLKYYLEEPNFDELTLKWTRDGYDMKTITIPSKTITDKVASYSKMISLFSFHHGLDYEMNITAANPNNCYSFDDGFKWFSLYPKQSIIQEAIPISFELLPPMMTFETSSTASIAKNSLKFTFIPPATPSYLYCTVQCADLPIPSVSEMLFREFSEFQSLIVSDTPYKTYHSSYLPHTQASFYFVMNDLIRGMEYRLACAYESADGKWRRNVFGMMLGVTTGVSTKLIIPTPILPSHCVTQHFTQNIDSAMKAKLIDLCQRHFTKDKGFKENGCVICTDNTQTLFNKGTSFTGDTCGVTTRQLSVDESKSSRFNPFLFTVCAQQDVNCPTDPSPVNFETQFSSFVLTIQTLISIQLNYNITDIPIDDSKTPVISSDEPIEVNKLFGGVEAWNMKGDVSFSVFYNGDNVLGCYYLIKNAEHPIPQLAEIKDCSDGNLMCGGIVTASRATNGLLRKINNLPFEYNTKYTMYFGCGNIIPRTSHSVVISLGSWATDPQLLLCPDGTTLNYPNCLRAGFIQIEWIFLLLMAILLI